MDLFYLTGYWRQLEEVDFDHSRSWEGTMIMRPNGMFEGIVIDQGSDDQRYVVGYMSPRGEFIIGKFVNTWSDPLIIAGATKDSHLVGEMTAHTPMGMQHLFGYVVLEKSEVEEQEVKELIEQVEASVLAFKKEARFFPKEIMDNFSQEPGYFKELMIGLEAPDIEININPPETRTLKK